MFKLVPSPNVFPAVVRQKKEGGAVAKIQKYVNSTGMPIILPTKHGTSQTFDPGAYTYDPWFSRYVVSGKDRLGRLSVQWVDVSDSRISREEDVQLEYLRVIGAIDEEKVETPRFSVESKREDTPHWTRKNGVYACKSCGIFSTGSRVVLFEHLELAHKILNVGKEPMVEVGRQGGRQHDGGSEAARVAPRSSPSSPQNDVPSPADARRDAPPAADKAEAAVVTADAASSTGPSPTAHVDVREDKPIAKFACAICQKEFRSKKGLEIHGGKAHPKG